MKMLRKATKFDGKANIRRPPLSSVPLVADLMTNEPICVSPDDTLKTAIDLLEWKGIRHLPVTGPDRRVIGLLTQRDCLTIAISKLAHASRLELDLIYSGIRIGDVMGRKVKTTTADGTLSDAAELLFKNKYGCLPVVDADGRLIGILTEGDFVKAFM